MGVERKKVSSEPQPAAPAAKPVTVPAKPKPSPPKEQESKPAPSAASVSKTDSLPGIAPATTAIDTPKKDTVTVNFIKIPLGGTVNLSDADSLATNGSDTINTVIVMPGPGFEGGEQAQIDTVSVEKNFEDDVVIVEKRDIFRNGNALLLNRGGMEFKLYNQIYSQKAYYDGGGTAISQSLRSTYFSSIFQYTIGLSTRVNVGVDAWLQGVRLDAREASPFSILKFEDGPLSRTAISTIGPRIRLQPRNKIGMIFQSTLLIPTASDPEGRNNGRPYLATENFIWWTQAYTNLDFHSKLQLYAELNFYWNINRGQGNGFVALPVTTYLSYFPVRRVSLQAMTQFWPYLGSPLLSTWWVQSGIGAKAAITEEFSFELMYGRFWAGKNSAGPANAYNFGLRYVLW